MDSARFASLALIVSPWWGVGCPFWVAVVGFVMLVGVEQEERVGGEVGGGGKLEAAFSAGI